MVASKKTENVVDDLNSIRNYFIFMSNDPSKPKDCSELTEDNIKKILDAVKKTDNVLKGTGKYQACVPVDREFYTWCRNNILFNNSFSTLSCKEKVIWEDSTIVLFLTQKELVLFLDEFKVNQEEYIDRCKDSIKFAFDRLEYITSLENLIF